MNNDLIDQQIIGLLRIPTEQRSQEQVAMALAGIAQAAQLETATLAAPLREETILITLQQGQLKLAAIADFLRRELHLEHSNAQLDLREANNTWVPPLSVMLMNSSSDIFMLGYGRTAEEALYDLHTVAKSGKDA